MPEATVLVIDDGSPDGTVTAAKEGALHPERLAVLQRPEKRGLGSAYRDGFRWANDHGATIVATLDADLSHDPADLPRLVTAVEDGANIAVGSRFVVGGSAPGLSFGRRAISRTVNHVSSRAFSTELHDSSSGFRAYRLDPHLLQAVLNSTSFGFSIQVELVRTILAAGGHVVEIPICFARRAEGRSKFSVAISVEAALQFLRWRVERQSRGLT